MQLSVVVPYHVKDRNANIGRLVRALERQKTFYEFEVLIVTDGFRPGYEPLFSYNKDLIKFIPTESKNTSYGSRNTGIRRAKGEWIAFTDADCEPDEHWLSHMVSSSTVTDIVVGNTIEWTNSLYLNCFAVENPYGLGTNGIKFHMLGMHNYPTCNVSYRKNRLGLFKELKTSADQLKSIEMSYESNVKIAINATVTHYISKGIWGIFKKRIRTGGYVVSKLSILAVPFVVLEQILGIFSKWTYKGPSFKKLCHFAFYEIMIHTGLALGAYFGEQ